LEGDCSPGRRKKGFAVSTGDISAIEKNGKEEKKRFQSSSQKPVRGNECAKNLSIPGNPYPPLHTKGKDGGGRLGDRLILKKRGGPEEMGRSLAHRPDWRDTRASAMKRENARDNWKKSSRCSREKT